MFNAFGIEVASTASSKIFASCIEPSLVEGGLTNWKVILNLFVSVESIPIATTNAKLSMLRAL